jgi:hypothetical protein
MPVIQNAVAFTASTVSDNIFTLTAGGASRYQFVNNGTRLLIAVAAPGATDVPSAVTSITYSFSVNNVIYAEDCIVQPLQSGEPFGYNSDGYRLHEITLTGAGAGRNELFLTFTNSNGGNNRALYSIYVSPQLQ